MRIAINGYFLQHPATGSGEHLHNLLEGLDVVDETNQYLLLYPRPANGQIVRTPHVGPHFRIQQVAGTPRRLGERLGKLWWEQLGLRRVCGEERVDLLHSPYFASPLFPNVPTVVTIHDVIPMVLPHYGASLHAGTYVKLVSRAARRAQAIITVSEASKRDVVRALGIPDERVRVIYNAVSPHLGQITDRAALEGVRDAHGITEDFLLYFGGFDRRKNVEGIIRAFHRARTRFPRPHLLVLAGALTFVGQHPLYPDPRPLIRKLGLEKEVLLTGRISEEEKPLLYSAATAFVFPSLYEGFGIPVLEAMACGTPVLTSNGSSLPEVAGDAALLVEPTDVEAMAEAMVRLVADGDLREKLRRQGFERVGHFSWERSALETLELYRQVLS